jgi:hypothetical protein
LPAAENVKKHPGEIWSHKSASSVKHEVITFISPFREPRLSHQNEAGEQNHFESDHRVEQRIRYWVKAKNDKDLRRIDNYLYQKMASV